MPAAFFGPPAPVSAPPAPVSAQHAVVATSALAIAPAPAPATAPVPTPRAYGQCRAASCREALRSEPRASGRAMRTFARGDRSRCPNPRRAAFARGTSRSCRRSPHPRSRFQLPLFPWCQLRGAPEAICIAGPRRRWQFRKHERLLSRRPKESPRPELSPNACPCWA